MKTRWGWAAVAVLVMTGTAPEVGNGADPKDGKVVIREPDQAKENVDFQIQGEYTGKLTIAGTVEDVGSQVIALGGGKFDVILYRSGLPGAGWDGETKLNFKAEADGKTASVTGKDPNGEPVTGTISADKMEMEGNDASLQAEKIIRKSDTLGAKPPEGAVVLFDGSDADEWQNGKLVELSDGKFLDVGTKSKQKFGDAKIHLEFRLAFMPNARGQGRSNSGVYVQDRYECQVLDSFGLKGLDNECGGFYKQAAPSVNMCLPPMQWQTFDIEFTAAKFDESGNKTANARATVYHNGVKIHDDVEFTDATAGGQKEAPTPGPIQLQNHGDPVVYRNIWVLPKE